jgi:hypothetical protein
MQYFGVLIVNALASRRHAIIIFVWIPSHVDAAELDSLSNLDELGLRRGRVRRLGRDAPIGCDDSPDRS